MIKHVIWSSMIDYPKNICTVLFTGACNFNCDYCYNKNLKETEGIDFESKILPKLKKRQDFINHVIISGGEPTIDKDFEQILTTLKKEKFIVGVHTNGSNPDVIKRNIDKIDFLGIDIKTGFEKYNISAGVNIDVEKVKETVEFVIKSGKDYEFRTTLFPRDVTKEDVIEIANYLKCSGANKYHLQQFYPVNSAMNIKSYSICEIEHFKDECNAIIPTVLKTK